RPQPPPEGARKQKEPPGAWRPGALLVEAAGVEPASANGSSGVSTCVERRWFSPPPAGDRPDVGPAAISSYPLARRRRQRASPNCRRLGNRLGQAAQETGASTEVTQPVPVQCWQL